MSVIPGDHTTTVNTVVAPSFIGTRPAGVVEGSVLIASFTIADLATVSAVPDGGGTNGLWQLMATVGLSSPRVSMYRLVVSDLAGLSASWTWTLSASVKSGGGVTDFRGVDNTTPEDVVAIAQNDASSPMDLAGLTTVTDGALVLYGLGIDADTAATITPPPESTEVFQVNGKRHSFGYEARPVQGATGLRTWTWSSGGLAAVGIMAALRPALSTYFRPPTYKQYFDDPGHDRLMSRVPFDAGLAVVDNAGVLTPFPGRQVVVQDEFEAATHVYMGGFVNGPLSAPEIANLVAAGYGPNPGPYLSTNPP